MNKRQLIFAARTVHACEVSLEAEALELRGDGDDSTASAVEALIDQIAGARYRWEVDLGIARGQLNGTM